MKTQALLVRASGAAMVLWLGACGGGGGVTGPVTPTPPATPAVSIAAAGSGPIVVHPSLDPRYGYALVTPILITESGGGSASWDFVRYQIYLSGREIERYELGSADISAAGYHLIAARSSNTYSVVYRQNSEDFDRIDITLGFSDQKDARQFTVAVPFSSFADVGVSPTPLAVPGRGTIRLETGGK
jgi:hypothetical protein